jgi:hypothetical protein
MKAMRTDELPAGGGSGGGPGKQHEAWVDAKYSVNANQISFTALPAVPPAFPPERSSIVLLAAGTGIDGMVDVRGSQGVRVSAGPAPGLPTGTETTNGVEVVAGPLGSVTIQRGLLPTDQKIELTPLGIKVSAGTMPVTIESLTEITLSVAGGVSKIRIGPEGVTIDAPIVKVNALGLAEIKGTLMNVQATGVAKLGGSLTVIG